MIRNRKRILFFLTILLCIGLNVLPEKVSAKEFPATFDPRTTGTITSVKKNTRNLCWAYAAVDAIEQNYVNKTGIKTSLSGNFYNYFFAANISGTYDETLGVGGWLDSGYGASPVVERTMNWTGPVSSSDFPESIKGYKPATILANYAPALHVQGFTVLPKLENFKTNTATEITERVNQIKELIQKNGNVISDRNAMGSYRSDYNSQNLGADRVVGGVDHVVTVVGWTDQFDKSKFTYPPTRNGAFIVKNNAGPNWGESGYYYISYEDAFFRGLDLYSFTSVEPVTNYKHRYGNARTIGGGQQGTSSSKVLAHVFDVPKEKERIDAVSIQTTDKGVGYEIYVNPTNAPSNGLSGFTKVKSGVKADIGAETIQLDQPIPITANEKFSVAIKYIKPTDVSTMLIPTDTGIGGIKNDYKGYELNDKTGVWSKQNADYLFNVYTNNADGTPFEYQGSTNTIIPENQSEKIGRIKEVFPDAVFAAEIAKQLEKTIDDYLTKDDAESITKVGLSGYNNQAVNDAQGIEHLVNLRYLTFQKGNLTSVDLSKNSKLEHLNLTTNKLTRLNLSNQPNLEWLDASHNNSLTELNISSCINLRSIQASENNLATLDLSTNAKLDYIGVAWNNFKTIDLSHCPELINAELGWNQMSTIDLSKNAKLRNFSINCNREFSTLDITHTPELEEVHAFGTKLEKLDTTKNPKLTYLSVKNNRLKRLDLKNNTELTHLFLDQNQLETLDVSNNLKLIYFSYDVASFPELDLSQHRALRK